MKEITLKQVENGFKSGVVRLTTGPMENGTVCQIGEHWFYFGGMTAEEESPDEYRRNVPEEDIIQEIFDTLESFRKSDFTDEYLYYYYILTEAGC